MERLKYLLYLFSGLASIILMFSSCEKFEGSQTIPAYIKVDSFHLVSNPNVELGFMTENFTDVWVYVDDQLIGAFEMPTFHIPILFEGKHKLSLYPGIEYSGMSGTKGPYQFIKPAEFPEFNFVVDSLILINAPEVEYFATTKMPWTEDFETGSIWLKPTPNSDTSLQFYPWDPFNHSYGNASGAGYLVGNNTVLELNSEDPDQPSGFELPNTSAPVFLELDYNSNNQFVIGLVIIEVGVQITEHPIVVINPTQGVWNKIYVNLTPTVLANSRADYFKVFIRMDKSSDVNNATLLLDNVKLLYKEFT